MVFRQRHRRSGSNRYAFIGRAKQQVEIDAGVHQGFGVEAPQQRKITPGIKQAGIEEVRAGAAGLQGELAEFQYLLVKRELDKLALIGFHYCFSSSESAWVLSLLPPDRRA